MSSIHSCTHTHVHTFNLTYKACVSTDNSDFLFTFAFCLLHFPPSSCLVVTIRTAVSLPRSAAFEDSPHNVNAAHFRDEMKGRKKNKTISAERVTNHCALEERNVEEEHWQQSLLMEYSRLWLKTESKEKLRLSLFVLLLLFYQPPTSPSLSPDFF